MKNFQRGFIQIPILIAILITAALGGSAYVAYEVAKPSQNTPESTVATTTTDVQTATSTDDSTEIDTEEEASETATTKSDEKDSIIDSLKKQVEELTQEVSKPKVEKDEPKTSVITLPSGAVIEIDANGNIIRTIKEASQQADTTPAPTTQTQTTTSVQISSVDIAPTITTAKIEWQTDKPTESKIFLSGGGLSSKVYNSESGLSTRHSVSVSGLKGDTSYSYEIEAIADGVAFKKTGNFVTQSPPPPTFSIETFTQPSYPNHFFMRVNSTNGNFEFKALTLEIDDPYGSTSGNSNPTNVGSIQNQTNARTSGYMTCPGARNAFESWNKGAYPYPCPGSDDPEADNPGYLTAMNPRANGDSASIPIHPDIPYPNGTRIYYYKVVDKITGKVFEYQK